MVPAEERSAKKEHPLEKLGLTNTEIARKANVNSVVICQVRTRVRHRPGLDTITKLCKAFPELDPIELSEWKWPRLRRHKPKRGRR